MSDEEREKEMTVGRVVFGSSKPKTFWGITDTHMALPENFYNENFKKPIKKSKEPRPDPTTTERSSTNGQERGEKTYAKMAHLGHYSRIFGDMEPTDDVVIPCTTDQQNQEVLQKIAENIKNIPEETMDAWKKQWDLPPEIDSPSYYKVGTREAIDYMRDQGILTEYAIGNVMKYIMRFRHKGSPVEDLNKAIRYIQILIEEVNNETDSSSG